MAARARYVFLSVVTLVAAVGAIMAHATAWSLEKLALHNAAFLGRQVLLSQIIGFGIALAIGTYVYLAPIPRTLLGEVIDELQRVSWPSRDETSHATWIVMVCVAITAACLGLFDQLWLAFTGLLLGTPGKAG